jgi:hypothetical protein
MLRFTASTLSIALAAFGGSVSVYGMMHFAPGAEFVVAVMGALFEVAKLAAYTMIGSRLSPAIKAPLIVVSLALAALNVVGLNGFLANAFEKAQIEANATSHAGEAEAKANVAALERQVAGAEARITKATDAMAKAKGDRDQIKAVKALLADATKDRDVAADKLAAAQAKQAKAEGATIAANGEMANIIALATVTGCDVSTTAHRVFLSIAVLPEILEALFAIAAGMLGCSKVEAPAAPAPVVVAAPVSAPAKDPKRVAAGKKAAATRARNKAIAAGKVVVAKKRK